MKRTEKSFPFTVEERLFVAERTETVSEQQEILAVASDALMKLKEWHAQNPYSDITGISLEGAYQGYHTLFIGLDPEASAFKNIFQDAHTTLPNVVRELLLAHAIVMKQKGPEGYDSWLTRRIENPQTAEAPHFLKTLNVVFA